FHVDRAAAVEVAVGDDGAERIDRPVAPVGVYHVDVMGRQGPGQRAAPPPRRPAPARPARRLARPGAASIVSLSMPSRVRTSARNRAPATSLPGGLVVSICR